VKLTIKLPLSLRHHNHLSASYLPTKDFREGALVKKTNMETLHWEMMKSEKYFTLEKVKKLLSLINK